MKYYLLLVTICCFACGQKSSDNNANGLKKDVTEQPYLILISLDGFRWDYVDRFKPTHLTEFIKNGVKAESLIPSYPSKTFPNHYTIATGMYPDHHNILGNSFFSYQHGKTYSIRAKELVRDGTYYHGTPIWVHASKAGLKTASYFYVGTEAAIQGVRPDYFYQYDGRVKNRERIDQALKWLKLPDSKRPHMMTLYFSDMDDMGHRVGPNDDELIGQALQKLDSDLGYLFGGIKSTGLPINMIIVSDHGMKEVHVDHYLATEKLKNPSKYRTVDNGAILSIHPHQGQYVDDIFKQLKTQENHYTVYRTEDVPHFEQVPSNDNWGPIQILPDSGYYFNPVQTIGVKKTSGRKIYGHHGYEVDDSDMHGIFYANGPAIARGVQLPPLKNIDVYPLMCSILNLPVPDDIDGRVESTLPALVSDVE